MKSFKLCGVKFSLDNVLNDKIWFYKPENELFINCKIHYLISDNIDDYTCQVDCIGLSKYPLGSSIHSDFILYYNKPNRSNCFWHDNKSKIYKLKKLSDKEILEFKKIRLLS